MFEVHHSGSTVREDGRKDSPLPMREGAGLETEIQGQAKTETTAGNKKRHRAASSKSSETGKGNQEHPAVKVWRDTFKMNLNPGRKRDIVLTVEPDGEQGLKRWQQLLEKWKAKKWNPLNINFQLSEYERTNGTGR